MESTEKPKHDWEHYFQNGMQIVFAVNALIVALIWMVQVFSTGPAAGHLSGASASVFLMQLLWFPLALVVCVMTWLGRRGRGLGEGMFAGAAASAIVLFGLCISSAWVPI